jgi:hypothetical protein
MLTIRMVRRSGIRRNRALFVAGATVLCCLATASVAQAVPDVAVDVDLPTTFTVGDTNVGGTVRLTATGTIPPQSLPTTPPNGNNPPGAYIGFCNTPADSPGCGLTGTPWNNGILLTPSCAQAAAASVAAPTCTVADPGVVAVNSTATGSGSACNGTTFAVTMFDAARGTVRFTPNNAFSRLYLGPPGSTCLISFTFSILKAPADALAGTAGLQTRSIVTAGAEWNDPSVAFPHYKPEPLRGIDNDVSTVTPVCTPPSTGTPPNCVPPPVCTPPSTGTPPNCVPPSPPYCASPPAAPLTPVPAAPGVCPYYCPPPAAAGTVSNPDGTCNDPEQPLSRLMTARLAGAPRCSPTNPIAQAVHEAFPVTVTVGGPLTNVVRVQFLQNGRVVRTLLKATDTVRGQFRITINPSTLAPKPVYLRRGGRVVGIRGSRLYTITAKVFLRSPGTFVANRSVLTRTLPSAGTRPIAFRAVGACSVPPPPPSG